MKKPPKMILAAVICLILLTVGIAAWLPRNNAETQSKDTSAESLLVEKSSPVAAVQSQYSETSSATTAAKIEFPFTGKIDVRVKEEKVSWVSEDGRSFELPFKFYYSDSGVWVRAEYKGPGAQYEDYPKVEDLYAIRGEKIVGLPGKPPKVSLQDFLTVAHNRVAFERASRIVIDYVILIAEPAEAEPVLILKVWGVEKAWPDSPDTIPRVRIVKGMDSGNAWVDDAL